MTLILSCITRDFAIQVSDRCLTWLSGPLAGEVAEDNQNKAVVVCNRLAFAYTGLAEIRKKKTDDWLLDVVAEVEPYNPKRVFDAIAGRASYDFQLIHLSRYKKRHAFIAVGWAKFSRDGEKIPFVSSISNALDDDWNWIEKASSEFLVRTITLEERNAALFAPPAGASLSSRQIQSLRRNFRNFLKRELGPGPYIRVLCETIREVASLNPSVGRNLMAINIPRVGLESEYGLSIPVGDTFRTDQIVALYFPADSNYGVQYGPHFTCDGNRYKDIEVWNGEQTPPWWKDR